MFRANKSIVVVVVVVLLLVGLGGGGGVGGEFNLSFKLQTVFQNFNYNYLIPTGVSALDKE